MAWLEKMDLCVWGLFYLSHKNIWIFRFEIYEVLFQWIVGFHHLSWFNNTLHNVIFFKQNIYAALEVFPRNKSLLITCGRVATVDLCVFISSVWSSHKIHYKFYTRKKGYAIYRTFHFHLLLSPYYENNFNRLL